MNGIYIPGHGEMSWDEVRVDRAVKEYDERLFFARNADTWDWCVFIKMPAPESAYPVLGFGHNVPPVDHVMQRLVAADTMRAGNKIYDDIVKSQNDYRAKLDYAASQAGEEAAEPVEWLMRKHGKSPIIKSLAPTGKGVGE
jgi:hypothetical protein